MTILLVFVATPSPPDFEEQMIRVKFEQDAEAQMRQMERDLENMRALAAKRRRKLRLWYSCGVGPLCQHRWKIFARIHGMFGRRRR